MDRVVVFLVLFVKQDHQDPGNVAIRGAPLVAGNVLLFDVRGERFLFLSRKGWVGGDFPPSSPPPPLLTFS